MCVTKNVLKIVENTIETYNMFNNGDTVVIGVSGGADSIMLLHCLNSLKAKYNLKLVVAHVNHKIRPGDAERDAEFVRDICKNWGVEFHLREANIKNLAKEWSMSEEEAGRKVRYGFFDELTNNIEGAKIATAHNANDNVETVLMRFMRGSGIQGLSGISFKRDNLVRPILGISRADIEAYIEENNLTHITDKTNFESIYTRNKIRLELIPFMQEMFNPNLIDTVTANIGIYREDAEFLDDMAEKEYRSYCWKHSAIPNAIVCSKHLFTLNKPSIVKRVIIKVIKELMNTEQTGITPQKINEIYEGVNSEVGTIFVLNDEFEVVVDYDSLVFKTKDEPSISESYELDFSSIEGVLELPDFGMKLDVSCVYEREIDNKANVCYIPIELAETKKFTVRTRKDNDIFRVSDDCHKKLNRVFLDKKVSKVGRNIIPMLCSENEVYWCMNYFATRFNQRNGYFVRIKILD